MIRKVNSPFGVSAVTSSPTRWLSKVLPKGDLFDISPSSGYALASVFIDPVFGGLVVGVLWLRTRNLLAPVFIHSLIDAISLLPMLE